MDRRPIAWLSALLTGAALAGVAFWLAFGSARTSQLATIGSFVIAVCAAVAQVGWSILRRSQEGDQQTASLDDMADRLAWVVSAELEHEVKLNPPSGVPLSAGWTVESSKGDAAAGSAAVGQRDVGEFFSHLAVRRLLILGQPGSGKTQLSQNFTRSILVGRRPGDPVPIPLRAAAWDPGNESLDTWMTRHLTETYGQPIRNASRLVADGLLIPMIDGLDELPASLRAAALKQLNRGGRANRPVVLTCRTEQYKQVDEGGTLQDATTLVLMPLSGTAVARYCEYLSRQDSRWQPIATYISEHPDGSLAKALSTPLMASLMHTVYAKSNDPAELLDTKQFPGRSEVEAHLLDLSVEAVIATGTRAADHSEFDRIQRRWLASLAAAMSADSSQGFAWWRLVQMAPVARRVSFWCRSLGPIAITAAVGLLALDWQVAAAGVLVAALVSLQSWPGGGNVPRQWASVSWPVVISACLAGGIGFILGSAMALLPLHHETVLTAWRTSQAKHDILGLLGAAVLILVSISRSGGTPDSRSYLPGLRTDCRIAIMRALLVTFFTGIGCSIWLPSKGSVTLSVIALTAFLTVLFGESAWGRYSLARIWLTLTGRFPWRFELFLNKAERAGILRRAEGVVQFRYPVLRDWLAIEASDETQDEAEDAVLRAQNGIIEEVLALPEAITFASSGTAHDRRGEVQDMAKTAITENIGRIGAVGVEQYQRFQQARKLMAAAVGQPVWSRPKRVYGFLFAIALGVALAAWGFILLRPVALVPIAVVACAAFVIGAVLFQQWRLRRRRHASLGFALPLGAWILTWTIAVVVISIIAPDLARHPPGRLIAIGTAIAAPLLIVAWAAARPYAVAQVRLSSDDPLQWPETVQAVHPYHDAAIQARRDWLTVLARDGVAPIIRGRLRQGQRDDPLTLRDLDPARLGGVRRYDELVETDANQRTSWLLNKLESGSIGISGTRGSGKSTLLQRHCTYQLGSASNDLLVLVAAPTSYDRREFLVYLFSEVCQQVIGAKAAHRTSPARIWVRLSRLLPAAAVVAGLGLIIGTLTWTTLTATATSWNHHRSVLLLTVGALLTAVGTACELWHSRRAGKPKRRASEAEIAAVGYLQELRFQSSTSRSQNGKLSLPGGLELGTSGQVQRTEQTRTYPELVALFRTLLDQVGLERRPLGGRVVIGIDEMDKMASAEDAEKFLNDLKAVFGVRGCYFLVAVSEDAMTTFDRRAVGVRTAFDTAFDSVVLVKPLTVAEARILLDLRGVSLPEPFLWLCHALAGGLPRDLLRGVLALAVANSTKGLSKFRDLAYELIINDVTTVLTSQLRHASSQLEKYLHVVSWLTNFDELSCSADELEKLIRNAPHFDDGEAAIRLVRQTRSYLYHAATLIRLFVDGSTPPNRWPPNGAEVASIDRLAAARAVIAAQPDAAWQAVDTFRTTKAGMPQIAAVPASSSGNGLAAVGASSQSLAIQADDQQP